MPVLFYQAKRPVFGFAIKDEFNIYCCIVTINFFLFYFNFGIFCFVFKLFRYFILHCFGGIGRTGTVVGCYLVRHGAEPEAALAEIARRRQGTPDGYRHAPETDEQRRLVLTWREPR